MKKNIILPALRGRLCEWFFYVLLMKTSEIIKRVNISKTMELGIEVNTQKVNEITKYISSKSFFVNSVTLCISEGNPTWNELSVYKDPEKYDEVEIDYMNRTFGILGLSGDEIIFPISNVETIQSILTSSDSLSDENEIPVVLIPFKNSNEVINKIKKFANY